MSEFLQNEKSAVEPVNIGLQPVGPGCPSFIIAEVAQAHDGSLGLAHSYIDAAKKAGADAIKFQTHIASAESTKAEPFRTKFSFQDDTRYEYWKRMEFTREQWAGLSRHAADAGLLFLSSPFSVEAVELLDKIGVPAWKIGSGEINNPFLLQAVLDTKKPVLLSSGMSDWNELSAAVDRIQSTSSPLVVFQCTSKYPVPMSDIGLNVIHEMRDEFRVPVGLSDHSGTVYPSLAAMAQGADIVEVHVVFSKDMFGPDTPASLTLNELQLLSEARDAFHEMRINPVDKNKMSRELSSMRSLFNKSVALRSDQKKDTVLEREMLTVKKPGTGIPAKDLDSCIGRRLRHAVSADRVLDWRDLEV